VVVAQCALTKLSYLLSKPSLSVERVRELMASPLRGELSIPNLAATAPLQGQSTSLSGLLSQLIHLISGETLPSGVTEADRASTVDSTAAWTSTQRDSTLVETALAPYLLSLAAARNDKEAMQRLLASVVALDGAKAHTGSATVHLQQVSGIVNAVDPASGRNALHTASLVGSTDCVKLLLGAGALVHLRDTLGHTA
jgi:lysophospholipase